MASPEDGGFLDIPYTIQMGDQLAKYGQANVREIRIVCLPVMASFRKEARSSYFANSHHISASKNCSCETVVSGSFVSIVSSAFTSCSTGRTEVKVLVSFWPEHGFKSDLEQLI